MERVDFGEILARIVYFMEASVSFPRALTVDRGPLRDL